MNISEDLKQQAVKLGLCEEWTNGWGNPNLDNLVEMYISGIDYAIKNNYPSNEYIKKYFGKVAEDHGVFTDSNINVTNPDIAILNGNTKGKITLSGFVSRDIYVRHDSDIEIEIKDNARAFIRIFDNARVTVDNQSENKVFVYKYIDRFKGKIYTSGNVVVRER